MRICIAITKSKKDLIMDYVTRNLGRRHRVFADDMFGYVVLISTIPDQVFPIYTKTGEKSSQNIKQKKSWKLLYDEENQYSPYDISAITGWSRATILKGLNELGTNIRYSWYEDKRPRLISDVREQIASTSEKIEARIEALKQADKFPYEGEEARKLVDGLWLEALEDHMTKAGYDRNFLNQLMIRVKKA